MEKEFIDRINADIAFAERHSENLDGRDGGYEEGLIISINEAKALIKELEQVKNNSPLPNIMNWVAFDFNIIATRPPEYGKYLITRKDGKMHWETWNGCGWAYNHKEIKFWAHITPPDL